MKVIESVKNEWVKRIKKLENKKNRDLEELYLIEGEHLVEEAIKNGVPIIYIITTKKSQEHYNKLLQEVDYSKWVQVTETIVTYLSTLRSPQPILAVIEKNQFIRPKTKTKHLLILDNVQDPGNVGTMIRTADAAGFAGVVLGNGTADVYNSKVVRSMQGSQFHISIEEADLSQKLEQLKKEGYTIYATELNANAKPYNEVKKSEKIAIVMGNEGMGVQQSILELSDANLYIPMVGQAESLNVAVAAGIIMFSI